MIHDLWYKNAVIYCLNVETYIDSNGDGVGDFVGLTDKLAYLAGLGVTCIWLLPFYTSPNKDDGYDVSDYYGVHPRTGEPIQISASKVPRFTAGSGLKKAVNG